MFWSPDGGKEETGTYKYNSSSQSITLEFAKTKYSMKYYGDNFPQGQWIEPSAEEGKVYNGYSIGSDNVFGYTKYFGDSCLVDHIVSMHEIAGASVKGFEKIDCSTAKYNGVTYNITNYSAGRVDFVAQKGETKCRVKIIPRFEVYEDDCKLAYEDFQNDKNAEKTFLFKNYNKKYEGDVDCLNEIK